MHQPSPQLSQRHLEALIVGGKRPNYDESFHFRRPAASEQAGASQGSATFYALREHEGANTFGAFGVASDATSVTVSIAFVDPFSALDAAETARFLATAQETVCDFYGTVMQDQCKFGARCRRLAEGKCTYAHGEAPNFFAGCARVLPMQIKKQSPGMSDVMSTWAICLDLKYPRDSTTGDVAWSAAPVSWFRNAAVRVSGDLFDKTVEKQFRRAGGSATATSEQVDLFSGTTAANILLLTRFCERQTFPDSATMTFEQAFGPAESFPVENTPTLEGVRNSVPRVVRSTRQFLGLRRLLIDVSCDVFNQHALSHVALSAPSAQLVARQWRLTPDVADALGLASGRVRSYSQVAPNAFVPVGTALKSVDPSLALGAAADLDAAGIVGEGGSFSYVKFNAPLREWISAVNMHTLHAVVCRECLPYPPTREQVSHATRVTAKRAGQHGVLHGLLQNTMGATVATHDGVSDVVISLSSICVVPAASAASGRAPRQIIV